MKRDKLRGRGGRCLNPLWWAGRREMQGKGRQESGRARRVAQCRAGGSSSALANNTTAAGARSTLTGGRAGVQTCRDGTWTRAWTK